MKEQDWQQQLRRQLEDFEEAAPEGLWADVEASLAEEAARARVVRWRRWMAAAAAVLLTLGVGTVWHFRPAEVAPTVAQPAVIAAEPTAEAPVAALEPQGDQPVARLVVRTVADTVTAVAAPVSAVPAVEEPEPATPRADTVPAQRQTPPPVAAPAQPKQPLPEPATPATATSRHRRLSVGLLASNVMGVSASPDGGYTEPMRMARGYLSGAYSSLPPLYLANYTEEADHKQPVTYGLSLAYGLTSRLWIEGGLGYSRLSSTYTHHLGAQTTRREQRLGYLNVPLDVGGDLYQLGPLRLYGSAGAEAGFCVKATIESAGLESRLEKDRVQFALAAHAGLECDVLPHLGLYVQPGLKYYPDNGSAVQNIYKDKPLNFDLQFGLRYRVK